jgi:geranylgeranyl pyrophosphate synthase
MTTGVSAAVQPQPRAADSARPFVGGAALPVGAKAAEQPEAAPSAACHRCDESTLPDIGISPPWPQSPPARGGGGGGGGTAGSAARGALLAAVARGEPVAAALRGVAPLAPTTAFAKVDPFELVAGRITPLSDSIKALLGSGHAVLSAAAQYFVDGDAGRKVRPALLLLLARAADQHAASGNGAAAAVPAVPAVRAGRSAASVAASQARLAEIGEMIHTAAVLHSSVTDHVGVAAPRSSHRLGGQLSALHGVFGNKLAVLAGDYLLARASAGLSRLGAVQAVELMATVIEHIMVGETLGMRREGALEQLHWEQQQEQQQQQQQQQCGGAEAGDELMDRYARESFFRTGSLLANGCRAAVLLGEHSLEMQRLAYSFGAHMGAALQLADDALDYSSVQRAVRRQSADEAHLRALLGTAPILLTRQRHEEMELMAQRGFAGSGDVPRAINLVDASDAVAETQGLAVAHAEVAVELLTQLAPSPERDALAQLAHHVVTRTE